MSARVVWKYPLEDIDTILDLPATSRVVLFAIQRDTMCAWVERPVAPARLERRRLLICGTGVPTDDGQWTHLGSAMTDDGTFVFHLFEQWIGPVPA